jgi:hypothetical protein
MKKLFISVMLVFLALPIFAQNAPSANDPRAKFQGIWYGVVYGEDKVLFIFIGDIFINNLDLGYSGRFSVEDQNLVMNIKYDCLNSGEMREIHNEFTTVKIQFLFSGEKLILAFDGEPITLSRNYEDFPEWW